MSAPRNNGRGLPTDGVTSHSAMKGLKPMDRRTAVVLYVVAMAVVIVGVDLAFFRNRFWERLMVNIGIVLVFAAFYLRFLMAP
jgi:type IV secretory pathway VirB2 component (pilin)